jgi:hypothetical protein
MISICRTHASSVKRWRGGQMALRWCAAGMVEAGKQFRRVNGHMHLRSLRDTLEKLTQSVDAAAQWQRRSRLMVTGPPPKFHGSWDILPCSSAVSRRSRACLDLRGLFSFDCHRHISHIGQWAPGANARGGVDDAWKLTPGDPRDATGSNFSRRWQGVGRVTPAAL